MGLSFSRGTSSQRLFLQIPMVELLVPKSKPQKVFMVVISFGKRAEEYTGA